MKIIERTEGVVKKIENIYGRLKTAETTFNKNNQSSYEKYLINTLQKVEEKMNLYELDKNNNININNTAYN